MRVAKALTEHAGPGSRNLTSRIGGDEFIMIVPRADRDRLGSVVRQIQQAIRELSTDNPWDVTASLGGICF